MIRQSLDGLNAGVRIPVFQLSGVAWFVVHTGNDGAAKDDAGAVFDDVAVVLGRIGEVLVQKVFASCQIHELPVGIFRIQP